MECSGGCAEAEALLANRCVALLLFPSNHPKAPFSPSKVESCRAVCSFITSLLYPLHSSPARRLSEDGCTGFSLLNKSIFIIVLSALSLAERLTTLQTEGKVMHVGAGGVIKLCSQFHGGFHRIAHPLVRPHEIHF